MNILLLDNYDSFTFNLFQMVKEICGIAPVVVRNDKISVGEAAGFDRIILSPGPGLPMEAGIMPELVRELAPTNRILGICLGHQCIGEVFGAKLENMTEVCHGLGIDTHVLLPDEKLFDGIPRDFCSGRYHSWIVSRVDMPDCLEITADDPDGRIMALRHKHYDVRGLQFHPESVLTPDGAMILKNWLGGSGI